MSDLSEDDDVRDMLRLKDGDDLALNDIIRRWQAPLNRFLLRLLGHERDALDLTQETFVRVYLNRSRYRPQARFSTWLYTIATNLARQHLRWQRRHPEAATSAEESINHTNPLFSASQPHDPAQSSLRQERAAAVRDAIHRLPTDLREVLILHQYESLPHAAIAKILHCTPKAVETRLYRARQKLKHDLSRWLDN